MTLALVFLVCGLLGVLALLLTWVERKQSAVRQDRVGANRAKIFGLRLFGLFQPFADTIKMMFKEDFIPPFADKTLHGLAPIVSFFFVGVAITTIPFWRHNAVRPLWAIGLVSPIFIRYNPPSFLSYRR